MIRSKIEAGIRLVLEGLEVDPLDHNFTNTPTRYAKAMGELFAQHNGPPTAFEESYTDFILVRGHEIWTLCPHHLLPVRMSVSLAYIPDGKVLGLSKLVRVMQQANSGPVMQERFTYGVRERLEHALETYKGPYDANARPGPVHKPIPEPIPEGWSYSANQKGICVLVEGWHGCMSMRGVKSNASTITMATSGLFETDAKMLDRFMFLVRGGR
jgi:GTP cyclohydrolase I